ncbi:hypothetical protein CMV30_04750 [Nibricoccus aquaticus]|uniref:Glycosyl hydrolase family 43 n=1 Tax=Nibricoccus aquaticus TaxID=2576891 RepID=A0A290QDA8_9BACT|nr:family 43 glycosylhydrolase [Nibricoccus aquaticus]ATC63318.1 hypothetical protein CMV30_04750 [Nibricoccus aquaticus]
MKHFGSILAFIFAAVLSLAANPPARVIVVKGSDRASSSRELSSAFTQLASTGGVIVLSGGVRVDANFVTPAHAAPITITSSHDGKDYQAERSAKLILEGDYTVNGPTTFAKVLIAAAGKSSHIHCNGFPVAFSDGISCEPGQAGRFPSITGGARRKDGSTGADITIKGGQWDSVLGGSTSDAEPTSGNLRIVVDGGRFNGMVCATGSGRHVGDAQLTLNAGYFYGGVAALANKAGAAVWGSVSVTINGGIYHNTIAALRHPEASFSGDYTLTINGGVFSSLTGITGTDGFPGGATSVLNAAPALLDQENEGTLSFSNPLIEGADPWVFQHDGFYYSTTTGYSQLVGRKVANLGDLPHAEPVTLYKPEAGHPYSKHLWSPKIYHLSEDLAGAGKGGFYLYFTANDGSGRSAWDHRLFVLRALTDDPLGPYGSPHDGTRDTPIRVNSALKNQFNDEWVAGPKVLSYRGKNYLIWVGRFGGPESKKVGDHWQCLYIDELINPWTVAGRAAMICSPTLPWEKHGAGMTGSGDQRRMLPEVIEGGTPIVTKDGTLYLAYAGSGYWTPHYAIGLMKLTGSDPMNPAHWQKSSKPIFKASKEVVGSANACYVFSPTGKSHWAIYHAYVGQKTRGVPRQLFAEPYLADSQSMSIGRGTPAPLGSKMEIETNPMPLRKKVSWFSKFAEYY